MSNYTKSTNFATKDNLPTGDPLKIVKGTEIDTEFNNIATAISTKTDNASAAITGGSITGITDLAIADGGTGASTATAAINNLLPSQTSNANKYLQTDGTNVSWDAISINTGDITGTLPVANGGTGVTSSTGTGSVVLSNSPTLVTPSLGAATASTLDVSGNVTLSGGTANTIPYLNGSKVVTTGAELYFNGTNLGVGASASYRVDLGSATSDDAAVGIRIGRGGSSTTWSLIDNVGGSGNYRQYSSGTPTLRWLTSTNGTSWSEQMRLNATGLGVGNNNPAAKLDVTGSALVSGSVTASQFYGSFNGAIGNTTAYSGAFTSLSASSTVNISGGTVDGVAYLDGSKNLTTGSVLSFSGVHLTSNRTLSTAYSATDYTTYPNGFILQNSATPATGLFNSIYFKNNANMQNVFGVVQNSSGYGDFVWAGYSGTHTEWMRLSSSGLTLTSNPTLSGGTANGVTYLNGSKVLTSGSALTFDGTNFANTLSSNASAGIRVTNSNGGISTSANTAYSNGTETHEFGILGTAYNGYGVLAARDAYIYAASTRNISLASDGGVIKFGAGTGASEQMRLTSTGLGIGTSSPSYKLDVVTTSAGALNSRVYNSSSASNSYAQFQLQSDASSFYIFKQSSTNTGSAGVGSVNLYESGAYPIAFYTSATERMRLDSAGNLGLGVTPSASTVKAFQVPSSTVIGSQGTGLNITTNAYFDSAFKYHTTGAATWYQQASGQHAWWNAGSGTAGNAISFTQAMTLDASGNLVVGYTSALNTASGRGNITVNGSSSSIFVLGVGNAQAGYFYSDGTNSIVANEGTGYLSFRTNSAERARIDSSGNLLIANTSASGTPSQGFQFVAGSASTAYIGHANGSASGSQYISFYYNSTGIGSITQSGTTAVLYNTTSDQRLKENIADADSASSLIDSLQVRKFDWKADGSHQRYGFVAQELVTVAPEAVHQPVDTEEMMAVDYSKLVPMLVKEIQSLRQRLAAANL